MIDMSVCHPCCWVVQSIKNSSSLDDDGLDVRAILCGEPGRFTTDNGTWLCAPHWDVHESGWMPVEFMEVPDAA